MADSIFFDMYDDGIEEMDRVLSNNFTYRITDVSPVVDTTINVISTELVGQIDDRLRKVFAFRKDQASVTTYPPKRGYRIIDDQGIEWEMQNIRFDDVGMYEVRADSNIVEN